MKTPRLASLVVLLAVACAAGAAPAPPAFVRTEDSDAWVQATFRLQERYTRVLLVRGRREAPQRVSVPALELNTRRPTEALEYRVDSVFDTLQAAADASRGGDLVAVMPGTYAGFVLADREDADDGRYVHFKALGGPGQVVIDRPPEREPDWMILLRAAHHVVIEGFNIAGATGPGLEPRGPLAGIMIDGDFGRSGTNAHHVAVVGNFSHNHRKWGLHSTDTHTVLIQDNLFALSCLEHSAYVSDGSDNYVIRRNVFYGSRNAGLQCNIDPQSSLAELLKHPRLAAHRPHRPTREWAMALLEDARQAFGVTRARSAPDFVRYGEEPWVLIEGDWWRVNPKRPDFRPRIDSKLLHGRGDPTDMPVRDLAGEPRRGADVGALGAAGR